MTKFILPTFCVLTVICFSFTKKAKPIFELLSDVNYLILDGSSISIDDTNLIEDAPKKNVLGWRVRIILGSFQRPKDLVSKYKLTKHRLPYIKTTRKCIIKLLAFRRIDKQALLITIFSNHVYKLIC